MYLKVANIIVLALSIIILLSINATARPIEIKIQKPVMTKNEPAPDYEDFTREGHTYTNVLRSPDVEYFINLKKRFKTTFDPEPSLRHYFESSPVMRGEISAVIGVALDSKGGLIELFVMNSSDITEFDEEAMRTVRASGPFAIPPKQYLKDDSILRMAWTFTVYL